ncbi:MAG TPA: DUF2911 domain-containing protein [Gemmatimonadetes bacterium]|nr:DUF2911 domain-containing protein [Gemmatimonadota bacterium]
MKILPLLACLAICALAPTRATAQQSRPMSPRGEAATQVGGSYNAEGQYQGGSWIVVTYGRPIMRGRDLFGSGDSYGQAFLRGAPNWRIGADQSTRFMTETDLMFGGERLPAGEYSIFAEISENEWTLIFADWGVKDDFREDKPGALWGSYGYTPENDVLRTTMEVTTVGVAADQLVIVFTDMTSAGGQFTVWWDDQVGSTAFQVAR